MFLALFLAGLAVRAAACLGYRPALWFNDSYEYVAGALRPEPYVVRPAGYSFFLRILLPFHSFELVVVAQHLIGLAVGLGIYVLLLRLRAPAWLAAAGSAPQLLDAYQIALEHMVLSETVFTALLTGAVLCLLWKRRVGVVGALGAGLLLSAASVTRSVGLPLALAAALWLIIRWPGWRPVAAFTAALTLPVAAYCGWYQAEHGTFAVSGSTGIFLYSRTTTFADCAVINPPDRLRILCPTEPLGDTHRPPSDYIWHGDTPLFAIPGDTFSPAKERLAREFAISAITRQPAAYLHTVAHDFRRTFESRLADYPSQLVAKRYRFATATDPIVGKDGSDLRAYERGDFTTTARAPAAGWLVSYQRDVQVPARGIGVLLLVAFGGVPLSIRNRSLRAPLLLLTGFAFLALLLPPATAGFDYRYVAPAFPFLGAAAALALTGVAQGLRRGSPPAEPSTAADPGPVPAVSVPGPPAPAGAQLV